ncbi:hypothetical protein QR680_015591 [Steinernema hermaphroditum]|uniref:G protein-coupled receptor n=1 Tax=Steinernema hermaphroditum TaxID=289476 RepID=A0AA39H9E0_9BILA|nr:hypothetical protein QR680_015591 [Steinernema hermaphroditum]
MTETGTELLESYESRFMPYRSLTIVIACLSIPLNFFTMYIIMFKSPPHLSVYKYVLLNISFWIFVTDFVLGFYYLPLPLLEIFGGIGTGLSYPLGPKGGFVGLVVDMSCVCESLAALLLAFVYRYLCISCGPDFIQKSGRRAYYWAGIVAIMVIPPGSDSTDRCPASLIRRTSLDGYDHCYIWSANYGRRGQASGGGNESSFNC